jgi:hypothetical protein
MMKKKTLNVPEFKIFLFDMRQFLYNILVILILVDKKNVQTDIYFFPLW